MLCGRPAVCSTKYPSLAVTYGVFACEICSKAALVKSLSRGDTILKNKTEKGTFTDNWKENHLAALCGCLLS